MICHFAGDFPSSYGNWHASCTLRVSYNGLCQLIVEKWNRLLHPRKHGLSKMGCMPVSDMDTPLTLLHVSVKCPAIYIYGRDMTGPKKKRKEKKRIQQRFARSPPWCTIPWRLNNTRSLLFSQIFTIASFSLSLSPFTSHALRLASLRLAIGLMTGDLSVVPSRLFGN